MVSTRVCGSLSSGSNPDRHPRASVLKIDRYSLGFSRFAKNLVLDPEGLKLNNILYYQLKNQKFKSSNL